MILLTFILLCRDDDFSFIQIKEKVLNTTEIVWKRIAKEH